MTEPACTRGGSGDLSLAEARRIALAAQGFGSIRQPRGAIRLDHLRSVVDRLGVVQLDSVNVLTRSHYLPFFSRLRSYDPALLDRMRDAADPGAAEPTTLVEYWAHEASLMTPATWPLFGFRMRAAAAESWWGMREVAVRHPHLLDDVAAALADSGPMTARALEAALAHDEAREARGWGWNWTWVKRAAEHLFWAGLLTSAGRTAQFERRYALAETVLPAPVWARGPYGTDPVPDAEAFRALVELAARAHGVGSEQCLRDYARLRPEQARPAIAGLVEEGTLVPVRVQGWRRPAYLHHQTVLPSRVRGRALLSPFDSLLWSRSRVAALFGFDYALEIYTPVAKRRYGYYVLPFLYGDALVARLDLKADRKAGELLVHKVTWEPRAPAGAAEALALTCAELATFLGLARVRHPEPAADR